MPNFSWETMEVPKVLQALETSETGLSASEAEQRLTRFGRNILAAEEKINILAILFHQFKSPLIYVLMAAAIATFFLREFIDMWVILAVIILNAVIGFTQEYKAEQSVRSLKEMVQAKARGYRDQRENHCERDDAGDPGQKMVCARDKRQFQ